MFRCILYQQQQQQPQHQQQQRQHQQQQQQQQYGNQNRNQQSRRGRGGRLNQNWRNTIDEPFQSRWDDDASTTGHQYDNLDLNESNAWL